MSTTRASFTTRARTWLLLAALTALFIGIGAALGGGALWIFVAFSIFMNVAAYWLSDRFAIRASRAQPVSEDQAPELYKIVRELSERYQLPMPRVYMIPSEQPNAFATGRNAKHAAVAVTQGLMSLMPEDQIRGVLAHEFGHIRNRDILVSSVAAMIAGAISAIGNIFLWTSLFGGGDDDDSPLGGIAALLIILIAPIAAALLQLGVSRQREYLADATAARVLGEGKPLADALATLERASQTAPPMQVNPATASLYIIHPFRGAGVSNLFNTHPPLSERIRRLQEYDAAQGIHYG
jgi:heat shock protein HtpX